VRAGRSLSLSVRHAHFRPSFLDGVVVAASQPGNDRARLQVRAHPAAVLI
jgi:hypothetical protein